MVTVINLNAGYGQSEPVVTAHVDDAVGGRLRILVQFGADVVLDLPPGIAESLCDALCGAMDALADPPVVDAR